MKESILALTRQLSQVGATLLMSHGYMNQSEADLFVGVSLSLVTIMWSVCKNRGVVHCQ